MINVRGYCADCERPQQSAMDLQKHPFKEEAYITVSKSAQIPDPRNKDNVIRTTTTERVLQKPAMICIGCLADATETPTAPPIWVGGSKP